MFGLAPFTPPRPRKGLDLTGGISLVHGTGFISYKADPYLFMGSLTSDYFDTNVYNFEPGFDVNSHVGSVFVDLGDSALEEFYEFVEVDCIAFDIVVE